MVVIRLVNPQDIRFTGRVSQVRVSRRNMKARYDRIPIFIRVIDVKQAAPGIIGMEGQPKQPLLSIAAADFAGNIQKWGWKQLSVLKDDNPAGFLDNKQPS